MKPTTDQVSGVADRAILMLLTYLVAKGYIDNNLAMQIGPILIGIIGVAWGAWVNRPKAIVQSAAALPGTTIVTTPDLSNATPEANIVSNLTQKVVSA